MLRSPGLALGAKKGKRNGGWGVWMRWKKRRWVGGARWLHHLRGAGVTPSLDCRVRLWLSWRP